MLTVAAAACGSDTSGNNPGTNDGGITSAGPPPSTVPPIRDAALAALVDETGLPGSSVTTVLESMESACADPTAWAASADRLVTTLDSVSARLDQLGEDGPADSRLAGEAVIEVTGRVLLQAGCDAAAAVAHTDGGLERGLDAAARVTGAYERFVLSAQPGRRTSGLWYDVDEWFHLDWIHAEQPDDIEVVLVGSSQMKRDVDPAGLTFGLGREVAGVAMRAGAIEVTGPWIDDVLALIDPEVVVWGISGIDVYGLCDLGIRLGPYERSNETRDAMFGGLPWMADQSWEDWLLNPTDDPAGYTNPEAARIDGDWVVGSRGRGIAKPGFEAAAFDLLMERHVPQFTAAEPCLERAAVLADSVGQLVGEGRQVILVSLPLEPRLVDVHPGGAAGLVAVVEEFVGDAVANGAQFIDASALAGPDDFNDTTHLNAAGQERFTAALAPLLQAALPS